MIYLLSILLVLHGFTFLLLAALVDDERKIVRQIADIINRLLKDEEIG